VCVCVRERERERQRDREHTLRCAEERHNTLWRQARVQQTHGLKLFEGYHRKEGYERKVLHSFFPSLLPCFLASLLPCFLASFLSSFLSFLLTFFLSFFLPSFFLSSFFLSFLSSLRRTHIPYANVARQSRLVQIRIIHNYAIQVI
jgi:hypothetical protein